MMGPWLLTRRVALRHVDTIVDPQRGMRERAGVIVFLGRWSNVLDDTLSIRWSAPLARAAGRCARGRLRHRHRDRADGRRGALAFWAATHVVPVDGDPFFSELQDVYDEIGESTPGDWVFPRPGELADQAAEISATGLFEQVVVRQFDWETVHDADGYIALLGRFSGHRVMQSWQRQRLYGEIRRRLARRPTGTVRRHWGAVLHVATRSP